MRSLHAFPKRYTPLFLGLLLALMWTTPALPDRDKRAKAENLTHNLVQLELAYRKASPKARGQDSLA